MDDVKTRCEYILNRIEKKIIKDCDRQNLMNEIGKLVFDVCGENENIHSVFSAGSLTRGDFILGVSDLDIFIVFEKEKDENDFLMTIESKCKEKLKHYFANTSHKDWGYDISSEFLPRIATLKNPIPINITEKGQLRFRAFDTKKCGKILYGENILEGLISENPKSLAYGRVKALLKKYHQKNDDVWRIMHIGDVIKAAQIYFGNVTYDKREVLKGFIDFVPDFKAKDFIFDFWEEYLDYDYFKKADKEKFMMKSEQFLSQLIWILENNASHNAK